MKKPHSERPIVESHPNKNSVVYPGFDVYDTLGFFGRTLESLIKIYWDMPDKELSKLNLKRAPGRNPPLMQTDYVAPEEEEVQYWPERTPFRPSLNADMPPVWWKKLWNKLNLLNKSLRGNMLHKWDSYLTTCVVVGG